MREHPFVGFIVGALLSLMAHGVAYGSLAFVPERPMDQAPSRVSFRVHEPPPRAPTPEPVKPPEPPPREKTPPRERPVTANEPPPPAAPPPVDLTGVTLTNDTGTASWSSVVGNGAALQGPIAAIRTERPAPPVPKPVPSERRPVAREGSLVGLEDLSERPVPPELASVLREHYPPEARARGIGGSASVTAEVAPDGRIRNASLAGESFPGFGNACKRTLLGSRWSPPRDREGRAVSTRIRYTCRFVVDR